MRVMGLEDQVRKIILAVGEESSEGLREMRVQIGRGVVMGRSLIQSGKRSLVPYSSSSSHTADGSQPTKPL